MSTGTHPSRERGKYKGGAGGLAQSIERQPKGWHKQGPLSLGRRGSG